MANKLFEDFGPISGQEWKDKITADLKGADFDKKLVWKTQEGFNLQPYYRAEDLSKLASMQVEAGDIPVTRGTNAEDNNWKIRQDFTVKADSETLNKKILKAIERGTEALGLDLSGLDSIDEEILGTILNGVELAETELYFSGVKNASQVYQSLVNVAGADLAVLKGSLGVDPVGDLVCSGELKDTFAEIAEHIKTAAENTPQLKIITIDAAQLQNAGGTLSQELGFGLAMGNSYFDELTKLGVDAGELASSISFSFATGPNYFMEIAKIRAAKWLWSVICKEWKADADMHIQSSTATWNLTVYDANVNMLRTTTEAMSASLGGSDVITVLPYDISYKDENDFSSRIARNTQVILKEEAYFGKVADPSAGSYYIEQLTESMAEQAWKHMLEAEEQDGFLEAFKAGYIQEKIKISTDSKLNRAASRRDSILGVNQFPNFNEMILKQGLTLPQVEEKSGTYKAIRPFKISQELEAMRMQTEKSAKRPKVFLLKYGDPVWMTARAMFSGNFFGCAGYEIIDSEGFATIEDGIKAASEAKADIVVLCSSDAIYPELGPKVQKAIGSEAEVVVAGYPKDAMEALKEAGIKHFVHVRTNLLEELSKFNDIIDMRNA